MPPAPGQPACAGSCTGSSPQFPSKPTNTVTAQRPPSPPPDPRLSASRPGSAPHRGSGRGPGCPAAGLRGRHSPKQSTEQEAGAQRQGPAGRLPHRLPRLAGAAGARRRILLRAAAAAAAAAAGAAVPGRAAGGAQGDRPLLRTAPPRARAAVTARRAGPPPPRPLHRLTR